MKFKARILLVAGLINSYNVRLVINWSVINLRWNYWYRVLISMTIINHRLLVLEKKIFSYRLMNFWPKFNDRLLYFRRNMIKRLLNDRLMNLLHEMYHRLLILSRVLKHRLMMDLLNNRLVDFHVGNLRLMRFFAIFDRLMLYIDRIRLLVNVSSTGIARIFVHVISRRVIDRHWLINHRFRVIRYRLKVLLRIIRHWRWLLNRINRFHISSNRFLDSFVWYSRRYWFNVRNRLLDVLNLLLFDDWLNVIRFLMNRGLLNHLINHFRYHRFLVTDRFHLRYDVLVLVARDYDRLLIVYGNRRCVGKVSTLIMGLIGLRTGINPVSFWLHSHPFRLLDSGTYFMFRLFQWRSLGVEFFEENPREAQEAHDLSGMNERW